MENIGFIGLGLMGEGMARNLIGAGYPLTVMGHRNRRPVDELVALGAEEVTSPADMAARCDIVFLCLPGAPQIERIVTGDDGLQAGARQAGGRKLTIVDCSTSQPTLTRQLAQSLAEDGITFIDAPLGGIPAQAQSGELQAIVGADEDTLARLEPVISTWAARIIHVGPVGAGHTMKLLNNFLAMGYGAIFSEALTIGARAGITPQVFDSVIRGSRMDSGFYRTFFQYVLDRDRNAHPFVLTNAHKDTRYLVELAESLQIEAGVARAVRDLYAGAEAQGEGERYVPELSDIVAARHGVHLGE
ncbi:NAD(P)-dependent oxidoreductase [Kushneria phosphatilytica]|uniref:NAD(P)-dependent oxidoreductase n=1 Tax=Kushneria phosphatilytica TaxID=657387 RepID=A0A1S1NQ92_9GAMM|nr:NAD(P)-dependent oxidoreductase [Kushneria phosphatilytica]OHV07663.1 3-hydroxyisobutyrate dehydrogenase [Kushneria phosphatilytica]QEL10155.1 NAD(P)-dependent oxidoreductase [Kushneria phosphatilytica]